MGFFKIDVNYTKVNSSGDIINKTGVFVVEANSREEAVILTQTPAEALMTRVNGTLISIE